MNLAAPLDAGLSCLGLDPSARQKDALLDYLALLGKWNKTYNLTAIHEPERMLTHHLLDSLALVPHVGSDHLLDVGSGAGLPGIPLAIVRPDLRVTLMDANQKKCGFMQQAAIELKLSNVNVVHGRVEAYSPPQKFAQIVSRAFSDLAEFARLTEHLLAPGGHWLAMKGVYPQAEIAQLKSVRVLQVLPLQVPGLDAERSLIIMEPV
jgi:16S rRNA (guanine527-N7)-methyltransferase